MNVALIVDVGVPVMVAALANGSDAVFLDDAVRRFGCDELPDRRHVALARGMDHGYGIVPFHERGPLHGCDHVQAHGHGAEQAFALA